MTYMDAWMCVCVYVCVCVCVCVRACVCMYHLNGLLGIPHLAPRVRKVCGQVRGHFHAFPRALDKVAGHGSSQEHA
jgi:hypothetical protein